MAKVFDQRGNVARQDTTETVANGKHVNHRCLWAARTKGATAIATSGSERELNPKYNSTQIRLHLTATY